MRFLLAATALVAASAAACSPPAEAASPGAASCKNALPIVTVHGARGVLLPSQVARRALLVQMPDVTETFLVSEQTASDLETGLEQGLRARLASLAQEQPSAERDRDTEALKHVLAHLPEYVRQYAGIVVGGKRRVLVNAFPADDAYCYRDDLVSVSDGGPWFWTVQYDEALKQYLFWQLTAKR